MSSAGLNWGLVPRFGEVRDLVFWLLLALAAGLVPAAVMGLAPQHAWVAGLGTIAALTALGLVVRSPALGALGLVVIVYWNASEALTKTFEISWLLRGAMIWTGIAWGLHRLLDPEREPLRFPWWKPVVAYGLVQCVAALRAASPATAWSAVLEYGKAVVVFYLVTNLLHTPKQWRQALQAVLVTAVLLSLPVIYQGLTGSRFTFWGFGLQKYEEIVPGQWGWRPGGSIGDPNFLAMILVATVPIAAMMALEKREHPVRRLLGLIALAAALSASALTYSRASALAVAFIAGALLLGHPRRKLVLVAATAAAVLLGVFMPQAFFARIQTLTQASLTRQQQEIADSSFRARRDEMLTGVLMARTHPLLGVGPGNYPVEYQTYAARMGVTPRVIMDPHSLYIQVAAETGLLGLGALLVLLGMGLSRIWSTRRRLRQEGAAQFARLLWGLELGLESYLLTSIFLHGAYFRHFLTLMALGALATSLVRHTAPAEAVPPSPGEGLPELATERAA